MRWSGLALVHRSLSLLQQLCEMVWDFIALCQFHLLFVNGSTNGFQFYRAALASNLNQGLEALRRLVKLVGKQ